MPWAYGVCAYAKCIRASNTHQRINNCLFLRALILSQYGKWHVLCSDGNISGSSHLIIRRDGMVEFKYINKSRLHIYFEGALLSPREQKRHPPSKKNKRGKLKKKKNILFKFPWFSFCPFVVFFDEHLHNLFLSRCNCRCSCSRLGGSVHLYMICSHDSRVFLAWVG